jgi:hypothetical protein
MDMELTILMSIELTQHNYTSTREQGMHFYHEKERKKDKKKLFFKRKRKKKVALTFLQFSCIATWFNQLTSNPQSILG